MCVTYVIRFRVIPEKLGVFLDLLNGVLDAMRTEPNFYEAILHRDPECSHHLLLYETWESHEDVLSVQIQRPYRQAWHDALPGLLREPRDITIWQAFRADQNRQRRAMTESSAPG